MCVCVFVTPPVGDFVIFRHSINLIMQPARPGPCTEGNQHQVHGVLMKREVHITICHENIACLCALTDHNKLKAM